MGAHPFAGTTAPDRCGHWADLPYPGEHARPPGSRTTNVGPRSSLHSLASEACRDVARLPCLCCHICLQVGKYQLGWREKLLFGESAERQERRKEKLEEIDDLGKQIVAHWHEFNRLHANTYKYIDKKQRLENKLSSQKRLDDFRKQFQSWMATNKRVGMCPEQYLTRWYTNYMDDLWTSEDVRTFYSGVREMTGPEHVRPESYAKNNKHEAQIHEMTKLTQHALPGDMNNRWKHLTPTDAKIQAPPMQRRDPAAKAQPTPVEKLWGGPAHGPPIDFKSAPSTSAHFLHDIKAVSEQRQLSKQAAQKWSDYSVNQTLPYLAGANMKA